MATTTASPDRVAPQFPAHRSFYAEPIATAMRTMGLAADPRHVEAYMRLEHGTLDALSPSRFALEVTLACSCIQMGGESAAEALAQSYGL